MSCFPCVWEGSDPCRWHLCDCGDFALDGFLRCRVPMGNGNDGRLAVCWKNPLPPVCLFPDQSWPAPLFMDVDFARSSGVHPVAWHGLGNAGFDGGLVQLLICLCWAATARRVGGSICVTPLQISRILLSVGIYLSPFFSITLFPEQWRWVLWLNCDSFGAGLPTNPSAGAWPLPAGDSGVEWCLCSPSE